MSLAEDDEWIAGEDALHSALASIPGISVIVFDHQARIRAIYGSALLRHGYVHQSMIGRKTEDVMPAAVWERLGPLYGEALAGRTVTFEQRSDDRKATYESTVSPVRRNGRVVGGSMTSRDITAQKTAEVGLSEATGQLQAILDHSPMAIYLRDLEHRWVVANRETCGILGLPAEQLLGRPLADTLPAALAADLIANDLEVIESGEPRSFEEVVPDSRTRRERHVWSLKFPVRDADGLVVGLGGVSLDVTDRDRASRELAAARELFERIFASAVVGMLVSAVTGAESTGIIECNPAFARMLGREPEELVGSSGRLLVHPDDLAERARLLSEVRAGREASSEIRLKHSDGHYIYALTAPSMVVDADGRQLVVMQAVDISERKRLEIELQRLADRDALTGLFSRRRFLEELTREAGRARRYGRPGAVLLLDLDGFKQVNDGFGHAAGDELLTRIAGALQRSLRDSDVLARMGGDEFALILPDTDLESGRVVAEKLVHAVRCHGRIVHASRHTTVTASVGITSLGGRHDLAAAQLLAEADRAMYQAKSGGKDRVAIYERTTPVAIT